MLPDQEEYSDKTKPNHPHFRMDADLMAAAGGQRQPFTAAWEPLATPPGEKDKKS